MHFDILGDMQIVKYLTNILMVIGRIIHFFHYEIILN